MECNLPLLEESIAVARDHGQGRPSPPNDLCLSRVAGLELRAIDQQQQPLRIVVAGNGQVQSTGNPIAEAIGSRRTDDERAAFGQLERLPHRAIACRGKRIFCDQFLAGRLADMVLPHDLQEQFFRAWPIGGVESLHADIECLAGNKYRPRRFQADREAARGNRHFPPQG